MLLKSITIKVIKIMSIPRKEAKLFKIEIEKHLMLYSKCRSKAAKARTVIKSTIAIIA